MTGTNTIHCVFVVRDTPQASQKENQSPPELNRLRQFLSTSEFAGRRDRTTLTASAIVSANSFILVAQRKSAKHFFLQSTSVFTQRKSPWKIRKSALQSWFFGPVGTGA